MKINARSFTVASAAALGIGAWAVFALGLIYAQLFVPNTYATPLSIMTSRTATQLLATQFAWWFTLAGLPIALASALVAPRARWTWIAIGANVAFWVLLWGFMYGDIPPRPHAP